MSDYSVSRTRIRNGIWEGTVKAAGAAAEKDPAIEIRHLDQVIRSFSVTPQKKGEWHLRIAIPPDRLSDGIQIFMIVDARTEEMLDQFAIITGEAAENELYAEVELLRAELDLLKKTVRRIVLEHD